MPPFTPPAGFTGTATNVSDYTWSTTQIAIPTGSLTGTVTITAASDTIDEDNETVIVEITSITNGTESGVQQQTVTILDDDPPPSVTLSVACDRTVVCAHAVRPAPIKAAPTIHASPPADLEFDIFGSSNGFDVRHSRYCGAHITTRSSPSPSASPPLATI